MKLCTNCNKVLKDSDTHCRYCAGETGTVPIQPIKDVKALEKRKKQASTKHRPAATPVQPATAIARETERISEIVKETKTAAYDVEKTGAFAPDSGIIHSHATLEIPFGAQPESTDSLLHEPASDAPENRTMDRQPAQHIVTKEDLPDEKIGPQTITVEFPFHEAQTQIEPFDENTGVIERELIVKASKTQQPPRASINKLGVTLVVIFVGIALVCGGLLVWQYFQEPAAPDHSFYTDLLTGTWVSNEFYFAEDEGQTYVELLTINSDGTFILQYLIPNSAIPNGYMDGSWEVYQEMTGTYDVLTDSRSLMLVYERDGEQFVFVREIINLDIDTLELREFYDQELQEYSDFKLKKIK